MRKIRMLMILITSIIFISCGNLEPYKKIISVEDKQIENKRITTYEDGSIRVENLEFIKFKEKQEREDRKSDRQERRL